MRIGIQACDLGLSRGRFGACALDTEAEGPSRPPLSTRQRSARAIAGLAFLGLAVPLLRRKPLLPLGTVAGWFGATHLLAAGTGFNGCPELGALPSLVLGRDVGTDCGPWDWLDARLRLT
jgi:hypothetical protein